MSGSKAGEVNGWTCGTCGRTTYAVHVDDGVTPMFLRCRESSLFPPHPPGPDFGFCEGTATSLGYPPDPPPHVLAAVRWEWYAEPVSNGARRRYRRGMASAAEEHRIKGGLDLRALTDAGKAHL